MGIMQFNCLKYKKAEEEKEQEHLKNENIIKSNLRPRNKISELYSELTEQKKILKAASVEDFELGSTKNDAIVDKFEEDPLLKKYKVKEVLGQGAFGQVLLVQNQILLKDLAMKIIRRKTEKNNDDAIENEINILKSLDHPNIIKIHELYFTPKSAYIITDYCPEGNLFDEIEKNGPMSESNCAFVINQMLMVMRYFHKMNIIHRDIKPSNIMITKRESNGCFQIKLIDFGAAKIYCGFPETEIKGTQDYIAPEMLNKQYDHRCDIWSLGITMYKLLTNHFPFKETESNELQLIEILNNNYNKSLTEYKNLSSEAKDLIDKFLTVDPEKRIKVKEALEHDWFKTPEFIEKNKINQIEQDMAEHLIKNILSYKKDNILKCTVMAYLLHNNSNLEPCLHAGKLFTNVDYNSDGKITYEELKTGLQEFWRLKGVDAEVKAKEIFNNLDNDHNNYIEYEEFVRAAVDPQIFFNENYLKSAFNFLDKDKSGDISINEIKERYNRLFNKDYGKMETELKSILDNIIIDEKNPLTYDNFINKMKNILEE